MAVLGIALIAMGEEIGSEMALRTFGHLVGTNTTICQESQSYNSFAFIVSGCVWFVMMRLAVSQGC